MRVTSAILAIWVVSAVSAEDCSKKTNSKLICYYSKLTRVDSCKCSHVVLPADSDLKSIDRIRGVVKGTKILVSVNEFNQGLVDLLKSSKVDGVEIKLTKLDSKSDISDFISTVRSRLGADLYVAVSVPSKTETLAKYYDFKSLSKHADLFVLETSFLGASKNVTFHPSRLSGLWDMQNTDSVVDLVSGLGAPLSKLIITAPVQAFKFKLQSKTHTAPGSPALEIQSITRDELCTIMGNGGNWTLERDQDQAGPYIFSKDQWIAFDDATSIDIKAKYARVRGLAGLALKDLAQDGGLQCESSILDAAFAGLSRQSRAPRGAVLHSLEREILETPARPLDTVQVSPYRISRVIDVEGNVHVIRQDTRTEFECSRQGYFVHPRSCGRFYRCVKFDQLSEEFSVFEFDCPAGLAFDSRVEVCVWPGSLPNASPCSGSSEIAPVPKERFVCPGEPGYYADPENCRWFFACLDHGKSPFSAYEFRCPFGLVYDESRLLCEWPWLVPRCASGLAVTSQTFYGGALDRYDGLGALEVTSLGGLQGPLQQPSARLYSNVGQLSLNAAQSLQNAGLLRSGLQGSLNSAYSYGYGSNSFDAQRQATLGLQGLYRTNAAAVGSIYTQELDSGSIYAQGAGFGTQQLTDQTNFLNLNTHTSTQNLKQNGLVNIGTSLGAGFERTRTNTIGGNAAQSYVGSSNANLVNGLTVNTYASRGGSSGTRGNINIVGGGFSAVGVSSSGLPENSNIVAHVTSSPVSLASVSSVPTITSVPLPALDVAGFESYKGGVVANVPELQYKIQNLATANISRSFVADNGYNYPKPNVAFAEEPIRNYHVVDSGVPVVSTTQIPLVHVQPVVTTYQRPVLSSVSTYQQKVQQPVFVSTTPAPATIGSINIATNNEKQTNFVGYNYPKPAIQFEEAPVRSTSGSYSYQNVDFLSKSTKPTVQQLFTYSTPAPVQRVVQVVKQPTVYFSTVQQPQVQVTSYAVPSTTIRPQIYASSTQPTVQGVTGNVGFAYQDRVQPVSISSISTASNSEGYRYDKPQTTFEEKPSLVTYQQPAVSSVSFTNTEGYRYDKPKSTIVTYQQSEIQKPVLSVTSNTGGYRFEKPSVVEEKPTLVTYQQPTVSSVTFTNTEGYRYDKPKPAIVTYQQSEIQKPVLSVTSNTGGYRYEKPSVVEDKPSLVTYQQPTVVSFTNTEKYSYNQPRVVEVKPTIVTYQQSEIQKPVAITSFSPSVVAQKPVAVSSFSVTSNTGGYRYKKPSVVEDKPSLVTYQQPAVSSFTLSSNSEGYRYEQPSVVFEEKPIAYQQPAVQKPVAASSFSFASNTAGFGYNKPSVVVAEKPSLVAYQQPTVSSFTLTTEPSVVVEEIPHLPTYQQEIQKPIAVSSFNTQGYSYQQPISTYTYQNVLQSTANSYTVKPSPQPATYFVSSTPKPELVVVSTTSKPFVPIVQPVAVKTQQNNVQFTGYAYPKPKVQFVEAPALNTYNRQPVEEVPFVAKKAYVTGGVSTYNYQPQKPRVVENYQITPTVSTTPRPPLQTYSNVNAGYVYEKPAVAFEERIVKNQAPTQPSVDLIYQYTPKPTFATTIATIVESKQPFRYYDSRLVSAKNSFGSIDGQDNLGQSVEEYTAPVQDKQLPVVTTSRPIAKYAFGSLEEYVAPVQVKQVPLVTTSRPIAKYSFSSLEESAAPVQVKQLPVVTTSRPIAEYAFGLKEYAAPVQVKQVPLVTTSRPIAKYSFGSLGRVVENYVAPTPVVKRVKVTSTTEPTREYLPVKTRTRISTTPNVATRPRSKTIVKSNNFHPLLSAKLGAQCTCLSNTLNLRNKKLRIIVEDDDDDQYIVDNTNTGIGDVNTDTGDDGIVVENYQYEPQKLVEITPTPQVHIASTTPVLTIERTATEAPLIVKNFDRYGPGGLRGRSEKLQGTIDCQRAGLFRHPTQCNKFYACRWDCTKNRYTLHVFNCPVHLTFDNNLGACNWPSQGPACLENTLLPSD